MEKRIINKKLPDRKPRRKTLVSREHLIAVIPLIVVEDGVGIDVPAIARIPVHVDRAEDEAALVCKAFYYTARQIMTD